jgi:hypothetical protein
VVMIVKCCIPWKDENIIMMLNNLAGKEWLAVEVSANIRCFMITMQLIARELCEDMKIFPRSSVLTSRPWSLVILSLLNSLISNVVCKAKSDSTPAKSLLQHISGLPQ